MTTETPEGGKLLPCPFCGGDPSVYSQSFYAVECLNKDCAVAPESRVHESLDLAITAWNTRAAP